MYNTAPIIRLEVEHMKRAIMVSLTDYAAQMDVDIQSAVESYCTPENIVRIVKKTAAIEIETALQKEVEAFFRYGNGRTAITEAVIEKLSEGL